jgi:hypothetical protein
MNPLNAHQPLESYLGPGYIYLTMAAAMHAASCLCGLDSAGATVHYRVTPTNDEEYAVTTQAVRVDGAKWTLPGDGWRPCYTITDATA